MKILLLGAGYVGVALLQSWQEPGVHFVATTTSGERKRELESFAQEAVQLRGEETERLSRYMEGVDCAIVAVAPKARESYEHCYFTVAQSLKRILHDRATPFHLLYLGSTAVYGDHGGAIIDEEAPLLADSMNGIILQKSEEILRTIASETVTVTIIRCGGIYGPERELSERAKRFSDRTMAGSGEELTNHVHRDDIVRAIRFLIERREGGVFNLVNDDHPSRKQLYERLNERMKLPPPRWDPTIQAAHGSHALISNEKIRALGFNFQFDRVLL